MSSLHIAAKQQNIVQTNAMLLCFITPVSRYRLSPQNFIPRIMFYSGIIDPPG